MGTHDTSDDWLQTIDLADADQVARACRKLGCTEAQLEEAIRMVGSGMAAIEQWIRWQRLI
jgi:uncharacterized protein DUF3606